MQEKKILHNEQLSWYNDNDDQRMLNYQLAFEEQNSQVEQEEEKEQFTPDEKEETIDAGALLRKRDHKWKKRLQRARKAAYQKGVEEGHQEGLVQAREEIDGKIERLEAILSQSHKEWQQRKQKLIPGLLDLVFDLAEMIVGLPVENPKVRESMEEELSTLLHEADKEIKPIVWVSESDYAYVEKLVEKYATEVMVNIRISKTYNPGEFAFDTDRETVVRDFKEMLNDFRKSLSLPSWQ